jgi:hypothetical protein
MLNTPTNNPAAAGNGGGGPQNTVTGRASGRRGPPNYIGGS